MLHLLVHKSQISETHTLFCSRPPVLSRCHGNTQLRLSQGHHVEDEVINSSILTGGRHASDSSRYWRTCLICDVIREPDNKSIYVLYVSSQRGQDDQKKKRTSHFCYSGLPRYTALDAVGWVRHLWIDQSEDRSTSAISVCFINYSVCVSAGRRCRSLHAALSQDSLSVLLSCGSEPWTGPDQRRRTRREMFLQGPD